MLLRKICLEKQIFKQIFEDLKKKGNDINSGIIIEISLVLV